MFYFNHQIDSDKLNYLKKIKTAQFISRVSFFMKLYENNLIFFEDDAGAGLDELNDSEIKENEESTEFYFCREPIYSKKTLDFLNRFYWSNIIPSTIIIQLKEDDFETTEKIRYRGANRISMYAILVSIIIGICSPILTSRCSTSKIENNQFYELIDSISALKKVELPK